jgi:predicted nucleotidyltransferase
VEVDRDPDPVAVEFARKVRERLPDRVRRIVLFGSRARGDAGDDSDYDVLVVVDRRSREVREQILAIEVELMDRHGSLVACLLRDEAEWEASRGMPIGLNVAREGVPL